ncbi:MAG TPA: ABC transporter ATP-binding protein [Dehalococcoidia bacterium]|nr:ABC transporter ATP-binding protein [Dehalococcoidia bacterium]
MLEIDHLVVRYGAVTAVDQVSLSVPQGGIIALVGANGSGKSTLLRAISGLLYPSSGTIRLRGRRIDGIGAHQIVRLGISQVPEGRRLFPKMTVLENLMMGAFARQGKSSPKAVLTQVYEHFPILKERTRLRASSLSGGEQQMLAIGRALMAQPQLLLLDEPSLGLAPMVVRAIGRVIGEINRQGATILLAEQNARLALALAQIGYVMETGRIALSGETQSLVANEEVKTAYLGV